tara:strand:+ start:10411 stop:10584 length:174 start_codon:yes stop_codon:yes gene_type:complete
MENKINEALKYHLYKRQGILNYVNGNNDLSVDDILENAEELSILQNKITALQDALDN